MSTFERLKDLIDAPLIHLAGGPITLGSLFLGLCIIVVATFLAGACSRAVARVLERNKVADGERFALAKIVRYVVILVGIMIATMSLGIRLDALLAASTVLLVGIGFGLQSIAQNFVSGLILLIERPVARGDFIQIGQAFGSVMDVGMRATRVVTRDAVTIIVPNSELVMAQVINYSVPTTNLRTTVHVGVAYGTDTSRVRDVLTSVALAEEGVLKNPAPEVRLENFGESSLAFALLVWIVDPHEDLRTASRLRFAIDAAFRAAGIEMPFPQQDVHIRSVPA